MNLDVLSGCLPSSITGIHGGDGKFSNDILIARASSSVGLSSKGSGRTDRNLGR